MSDTIQYTKINLKAAYGAVNEIFANIDEL